MIVAAEVAFQAEYSSAFYPDAPSYRQLTRFPDTNASIVKRCNSRQQFLEDGFKALLIERPNLRTLVLNEPCSLTSVSFRYSMYLFAPS